MTSPYGDEADGPVSQLCSLSLTFPILLLVSEMPLNCPMLAIPDVSPQVSGPSLRQTSWSGLLWRQDDEDEVSSGRTPGPVMWSPRAHGYMMTGDSFNGVSSRRHATPIADAAIMVVHRNGKHRRIFLLYSTASTGQRYWQLLLKSISLPVSCADANIVSFRRCCCDYDRLQWIPSIVC